jgi:hypothetical protein
VQARTVPLNRGGPSAAWVAHTRGYDFTDCGFEVIGHVPAPSQADQYSLVDSTASSSGWEFWQRYLRKQDELLGEQLAAG